MGSSDRTPISNDDTAVAAALSSHWRTFVIEGAVLMVLGASAIVLPQFASLAVEIVLGWLFLIGGGIGLVSTVVARSTPGYWWALASALAGIFAGVLMIRSPVGGVISLTFILTAFLVVDGLIMIMFGIEHRRQLSRRWEWLVVNGVLDLVLAAIVVVALPGSITWVLGLIVGIDLLFGGSSLIALALATRPK
ncbi:MAG: HdeD family acid-resistance protein [Rhizomicrobium sp.]|jgi:uncharacterized membrane protein HdeD (DUF308 family)